MGLKSLKWRGVGDGNVEMAEGFEVKRKDAKGAQPQGGNLLKTRMRVGTQFSAWLGSLEGLEEFFLS